MRLSAKIFILIILLGLMAPLTSCSRSSHKVKVVKPRKHYGWFDSKKDRKKKRTKIVKYKVH